MLLFSCGRFSREERATEQSRIVCIAKQYTEIMYALHAEKDLIAVDVSSTYPAKAKELRTIGYHRALSTEPILAVKPTLIIHDNNIGPEPVLKQLKDLNIPQKVFGSYGSTIEGTDSLIREMGAYFKKEEEADSLCRLLHDDMEKAMDASKKFGDTVKVAVIHYGQASNVYLVMTSRSTAAKMVEWAGGKIAVEGAKGMSPLSAELIAASDPDVILLTDFGYDKLGNIEKIKELPGIAGTKAARNNRIYRIEEHDLVYMGPRTGKNTLMLQELIHRK